MKSSIIELLIFLGVFIVGITLLAGDGRRLAGDFASHAVDDFVSRSCHYGDISEASINMFLEELDKAGCLYGYRIVRRHFDGQSCEDVLITYDDVCSAPVVLPWGDVLCVNIEGDGFTYCRTGLVNGVS